MTQKSDNSRDINIRQSSIDQEVLDVLAGIREGSEEEKRRVEEVLRCCGDAAYSQAIYLLTRTIPQNPSKAKQIFDAIVSHRHTLSSQLRRAVSLNVAALDWVESTGEADLESASAQTMFGRHMVQAIENLGNSHIQAREYLIPTLDKELEKGKKEKTPVSIVLLDVSHLGDIHTAYGYTTENQVMRSIKEKLTHSVHSSDKVFHHDRNRFMVILPGVGRDVLDNLAERLRESLLQEIGHTVAGDTLIRSGAATAENPDQEDSHRLIEEAEQELRVAPAESEKNDSLDLSKKTQRRVIHARSIVPGLAIGKIFIYQDVMSRDFELRDLSSEELNAELQRITTAISRVKEEIDSIQQELSSNLSPEQVAIFEAQKTILEDPYLQYELERQMKEKMINAEYIVRDTFRNMSHQFLHSENEIIRQKSADIADIERRILMELTGTGRSSLSEVPPDAIVLTKRLLPSDTITLNTHNVRAFVTEEGSKSSHSAMLARALGLPYISEIPLDTFKDISSDSEIIVDGEKGEVILFPTSEEKQRAAESQRQKELARQEKIRKGGTRGLTYRDRTIRIAANISVHSEAQEASNVHCDGVGLFRIETLFMMHKALPTEDNLIKQLSYIMQPLKNHEITIRLLDIGGEKNLPYLNIGEERNPLLGLRGIRLLRRFPGLLRSQIRAFLRLGATHRLRILIPMTSLSDDVLFIRDIIQEESESLRRSRISFNESIPLGAMIETPAAVLDLDNIVTHSDFLSIGTNDLVQYAMAADREKMSVTDYYEAGTGLIVDVVGQIVKKAHESGKSCMVCGEMAADTTYTKALLDAGLNEFSVPPSQIPLLREKIYELNI